MTITATIWGIITDYDELRAELTRITRQEYEPFLTHEKAAYVNTYKLEQHVREALIQWYEWLPDRAISQIGGELAMEAFHTVDWKQIASLILDELQAAGSRRGGSHERTLQFSGDWNTRRSGAAGSIYVPCCSAGNSHARSLSKI